MPAVESNTLNPKLSDVLH